MDGASWPARWPPPAPSPSPSAPPPPLTQQMDNAALRHLLRPFASLQAGTAVPEQPVVNVPTAQTSLQPASAGSSNGSLAQIPGSYSAFGAAPDLKAMLDKLNASNAAAMVDLTRASYLGGVTSLSKYPRHGPSAISSYGQSPSGTQFLNRRANGMGTFTSEGSANEGVTRGGIQFQDSSAQTLQMLPFKSTSHHPPPPLGDSIRVSCLNIGGEFFMGGDGLFGVICSCHRLKMSIAKFCEHVGGPAEKAGEIVRVENGMSISQWFKFWTGVEGSFADTKWDWPEWSCAKTYPEEYRLKSLPSRNNSIGQTGLLGGYGNSTGPLNKQVCSNDMYTEGRGCTNVEKIVKRPDETNYKKGIDMHEAFANKSALLQSSMIMNLGLDKSHKVNELDLSPHAMPSGILNFKASAANHCNGNQRAYTYGIFLGKNVDASFRNHGPNSTGVLNHDSRACRPDGPHKIFQDGLNNASNTELKLGQASYHQSMSTLFPSMQSTIIEFQKPQSHVPLIAKDPCPKQTTNANRSIAKHGELPFVNGNKEQLHEVAYGTKHSQVDALTDGTTNNSFISLFLSHLERNSAHEPIDDILNSNEQYVPKALGSTCNSDHSKIANGQTGTKYNDNHSKLPPSVIHKKGRPVSISHSATSSGYNPQELPHANSQERLIYGDCQSHLVSSQPDTGISKICEISCPTSCRSCTHVSDKSHQIAHAEIGVPCFCDKMAKTQETFGCVDDLCAHRSLRAFAKVGYKNGKCCCSSRKLLPSFCQNDNSNMGNSICGCCCKINEDVSKFGFIPGHLCRTQFSDDGPILTNKLTHKGLDGLCTCGTLTQRSSLCSGEHILQSSCYACPVDGFHHRSYRRHAIDNLTKNTLFDALSMKEQDCCCHGSCCYSAVPKYLSSCGFPEHRDVGTDHIIPDCEHQLQMPAICGTSRENEKSVSQCLSNRIARESIPQASLLKDVSNEATNQPSIAVMEKLKNTSRENEKSVSQCLSNRIARESIPQASLLKDVSNEATNQPSVAIMEKLKNASEASMAGDSWSKAVTEKNCAYGDSVVSKGYSKVGFSSGSSSAVVTKFPVSSEFKNISSCNAEHNKSKNLCDEVSRIQECSVSSYETECEKALNSLKRIPESHLGSSRVKRKCNQISDGSRPVDKGSEEHCFELSKKILTHRCSVQHSDSDDCTTTSSQSSQNVGSQPQKVFTSFSGRVFGTKRKYATMHQNKSVKRLHSQKKMSKDYDEQQSDKVNFLGEKSTSGRKKQVKDVITQDVTEQHEGSRMFARKLPKYVSLNCIINEPKSEDACSGNAGMDSTLNATGIANDNRKSPKIVPLNLILKKAKRCRAVKTICKAESMHSSKENSSGCSVDSSDCSVYKSSVGNENCSTEAEDEMQVPQKSKYSPNDSRPHIEEGSCRSPCGAVGEDEPPVSKQLSVRASRGVKNRRGSVSLNRIKRLENFSNRSACNFGNDEGNAVKAHEVNATRYSGRLSSDASCCVCGILNLEPCNQLIECSKCYIKVHQGCYGVLKVPRGQWFCRPCKANSRNTVCVLCGYGGGAMARALKHKKILKSLLKGLTVSTRAKRYTDSFETMSSECTSLRNPTDKAHEDNIISTKNIADNSWISVNHNSCLLGQRNLQWVHVVCGLWTPGTKCPNATTMGTFDVSGALPAKRNTACSLCSRTGGSFIKCRDLNCPLLFHPWCGHQRGLLQSEPEGEHNESVGFYGRCMDHASDLSHPVNPKNECLRKNDWTCARTEGFKGRKGEGVNHKASEAYCGEFSVSQEQINAWLHINGSKSCGRGQMEYTHYKQLKGWKHLVVYKSGIHGLGLYTSVFIQRGSMVVEYVGEIIGQHIADKREIEYQSGKRQQYKSACYFFKIDREHIIDATRKGGIARFVNHSCQPNCVAKIISVRNEKKVVFFAERHINPGEEITYDYHFNREDEGQRIPCLCRSRHCRRYLN